MKQAGSVLLRTLLLPLLWLFLMVAFLGVGAAAIAERIEILRDRIKFAASENDDSDYAGA